MKLEPAACYEAIRARDRRFDGVFYVGVTTTGIYCRPVCTARTPGRDRCRWFGSAAGAEGAGFRPCLRCRPELAPGLAPLDAPARVAQLAVARIEAGALSGGGLPALAGEFGIGERQLRRVIQAEYGVTPVDLAQTRRLLLAKQLLTDTALRMTDVAHASGFSSVRRFNHLFRTRYGLNPQSLRRKLSGKAAVADGSPAQSAPVDGASAGGAMLRLGYRPPLAWDVLAGFLASRGAPAVERFEGGAYLRSVRLDGRSGWIRVAPARNAPQLEVEVAPSLLSVLAPLRARLRGLFDLDANPLVIEQQLSRDPALAASCARWPGLRVPGAFDGFEVALRAVLGQQVTVRAATTLYGRFVQHFGETAVTPHAGLDRHAPLPAVLADAGLQQIIDRGLPRTRAQTVKTLARAVASGALRLAPAPDHRPTLDALQALPGIGPWTANYVAMRVLGDPDTFPDGDLGLLRALGLSRAAELRVRAEAWRPWRAYAVQHIWRIHAGG